MLCEECNKNQATVSITVTSGEDMNTRHLCPECMKKMELSLAHGDIQSFLSSILAVLSASKTEKHQPTCTGCGLTYSAFEQNGRLGCAQCYMDFSEQLKPLLQRIHGRTQHAGRVPASFANNPQKQIQKQCDELRQKMDEAVASENFEDAAKYRDELRALSEHEEANLP
ncbi:MAG: hypothetical protein GX096_15710 [Clostridiales bacterium]|nr:hypothetical protein [Clostridiales bacterium]